MLITMITDDNKTNQKFTNKIYSFFKVISHGGDVIVGRIDTINWCINFDFNLIKVVFKLCHLSFYVGNISFNRCRLSFYVDNVSLNRRRLSFNLINFGFYLITDLSFVFLYNLKDSLIVIVCSNLVCFAFHCINQGIEITYISNALLHTCLECGRLIIPWFCSKGTG